jgi:ATP-binding protein involved in chromosome partitioning
MKVEDFVDPYVGQSWGSLGARILTSGKQISVTLGYPAEGMQADLATQLAEFLGVQQVELQVGFAAAGGSGFGQVKHVILVSSGKGGVGKSTTAVNLALALDAEGAKVGLLDADIYGPSQGMMLGVAEGRRPDIKDGKFFEPIRAHGLKAMSMSFMTTDKTPMVWRGPMASGALQQILGQTLWGDLDYLVVDMPPGTGDIQLTLSQKAPVSGAVIVTTPQGHCLARRHERNRDVCQSGYSSTGYFGKYERARMQQLWPHQPFVWCRWRAADRRGPRRAVARTVAAGNVHS